MNKKLLFLPILGGLLISCSQTPKCDDKDVLELVTQLNTVGEKNSLHQNSYEAWTSVLEEVYATEIQDFDNKINEINNQIDNKNKEVDKITERLKSSITEGYYNDDGYYIDGNYEQIQEKIYNIKENLGKENEILYNKLSETQKEYSDFRDKKLSYLKHNYDSDEKIKAVYTRYFVPKNITNIITTNTNKDFKNCECKATIEFSEYDPINVLYSAQMNENKELLVEIIRK